MPTQTTKDRLLDAAEQLFAEHGYDATSMRELTTAAEVNLAAVNYHFGSKRELFAAVFERRVGPINTERLERIDLLEARVAPPPSVEELLEALLAPALLAPQFDSRSSKGQQASAFLRLIGRLQSESGEHAEGLREVFEVVQRRFALALGSALPELEQSELTWRLFFLIGAMCTALADPHRMQAMGRYSFDSEDREEMLAQLIAFGCAGLRAPSTAHPAGQQEES